ncbi:MAG: CFI-box-CTERM domain-containing protein [Candidatus Xenobiia bacterium LiM19]
MGPKIGTGADTYTLKAESEKGWADLSALPATVQIGAGQTVQYTINVKVPSSVSAEGTDTLYFEATSTNSPDMMDSSEVTTELVSETSYDQSGLDRAVSGSNQGCFIATAAYGSPLDPHVVSLRRFRDSVLLKSLTGSLCVRAYYYCSPPLADYIAHRPMLRSISALLLTPLVWGVEYPLPASVMVILFIFVLRGLLRFRQRGTVSQRLLPPFRSEEAFDAPEADVAALRNT